MITIKTTENIVNTLDIASKQQTLKWNSVFTQGLANPKRVI